MRRHTNGSAELFNEGSEYKPRHVNTSRIPFQNSLDFLRFAFAFIVLLVHAYEISENKVLAPIKSYLDSGVAVQAFFVISGFLIVMSYERSKSVLDYLAKRAQRIYPAYFFVVLACAGFGVFLSTHPPQEYFLSPGWFKYLAANLAFLNFLHPSLPGVFSQNPFQAVNGPLWTIKIEVMFYLSVPFISWLLRKTPKFWTLLTLYALSLLYFSVLTWAGHAYDRPIFFELAKQFPGQLAFFISGSALFYYFETFSKHQPTIVLSSMFFYFIAPLMGFSVLAPASLAVIIIFLAFNLPLLNHFGKIGDLSYGIYIYHFPVLQIFIAYGLFSKQPGVSLLLVCILVLTMAALSWHFLEKRFLWSSRHRDSDHEAAVLSPHPGVYPSVR